MAYEHHAHRRGRLPTITTGEMGLPENPQEILPHHNAVVKEICQTYATTYIYLGRNHAQT